LNKSTRTRGRAVLRWAALASVIGLVICLTIVMSWDDWVTPEAPEVDHRAQPERPSSREGRDAGPSPMYEGTTEIQAEPPIADPFEVVDDELVEAMIRVPVDNWHAQRVENIGREAVQQLVENLANFDDMHLATTSVGYDLLNGTYDSAVHRVAHLFRVRRLLAIEKESPGTVTSVMMDAYAKALKAWPSAYRDWTRRWYGPAEGLTAYEPFDIDKAEMGATVATYFLGESGDPEMLGVLLDGYQTHQRWLDEYKRAARTQCPVPPAFTLYAIHRLVSTAPEGSLRAEGRAARKTYLSWAEDHIPSTAEVEVSASNAMYDEAEGFRRIADPKNVLLRGQPKMVMTVYPSRFKDGTAFEPNEFPDLSQEGQEWRKRLFAAARAILKK